MVQVKQEHTTNLLGADVVSKTHPRIELRGRLDELNARVILLQTSARGEGVPQLADELEEVHVCITGLIASEVRDIPCGELSLWGLSESEIHERSHYTDRFLGMPHIRPHESMGRWAAEINLLRTIVREAELCACRAFDDGEGGVTRPDLVKMLNRLSSAFYILSYRYLPDGFNSFWVFQKR